MGRMSVGRACCLVALAILLPSAHAWAKATFTISVTDGAGVGFNDTTPAKPVGGNTGTTLGEQRLLVVQTAAEVWARIIDSSVPIVVQASFTSIACTPGLEPAGLGTPVWVKNYPGLPTTGLYPTALASMILGKDVSPNDPEIKVQFNSNLAGCSMNDWYLGLDRNGGDYTADMVETAIHEIGHGLGFSADLNPSTGAFNNNVASAYSTHMLDNKSGKHFSDMTDAERKIALGNVRQMVWDGPRTDAVAARFFAKGRPSLQISPKPTGFSGAIREANFGRLLADGPSVVGGVATSLVTAGCVSMGGSFAGKIALIILQTSCPALAAASDAERAGALAMLFAYDQAGSPPPYPLEGGAADIARANVSIPTLAITLEDANLIKGTAGATATLSADKSKSVGTDDAGHALLFAANPTSTSSIGCHWDPIARPNLIMEASASLDPVTYLDMERALLWDLGWTSNCGNGTLDEGEACDNGVANSDYFPDACRLDCTKARCGDGVIDSGEACDPGHKGVRVDPNCDANCRVATGGGGSGGSGGSSGKGGASGTAAGGNSGSTGDGGSSGLATVGGTVAVGGSTGNVGQGGAVSAVGGSTDAGSGSVAGSTGSSKPTGKGSSGGCSVGREIDLGGVALIFGFACALWLRRRGQGHGPKTKVGPSRP